MCGNGVAGGRLHSRQVRAIAGFVYAGPQVSNEPSRTRRDVRPFLYLSGGADRMSPSDFERAATGAATVPRAHDVADHGVAAPRIVRRGRCAVRADECTTPSGATISTASSSRRGCGILRPELSRTVTVDGRVTPSRWSPCSGRAPRTWRSSRCVPGCGATASPAPWPRKHRQRPSAGYVRMSLLVSRRTPLRGACMRGGDSENAASSLRCAPDRPDAAASVTALHEVHEVHEVARRHAYLSARCVTRQYRSPQCRSA